MEYPALQISVLAVLSPILIAAGVLYLLSTAHLGVPAAVFNGLAVLFGSLRVFLRPAGNAGGLVTVFFVLFLALALTADVRLGLRLRKSLAGITPPARPSPPPAPRAASRVPAPPKPVPRREEENVVKVLSPTSWMLHNTWGDIRVYTVPSVIADQNQSIPASDRKFRITYDEDEDPIEGVFTVSPSLQILLLPDDLDRLRDREFLQFEIVG